MIPGDPMRLPKSVFTLAMPFVVLAGILLVTVEVKGQNKGGNKANAAQEKRDEAKIKDAKEDVAEAEARIKKNISDIRSAEAEAAKRLAVVGSTRQAFEQAKDRVQTQEGRRLGIDRAMSDLKDAQVDFESAAAPVLEKLYQSAGYQAAVKDAAIADEASLALQQRKDLAVTERQAQSQALSVRSKRPNEMKREAIDAVPTLKPLKERLAMLQAKLDKMRDEVRRAIENSSEVKNEERKWEQSKKEHEIAEAKADQLKRQLAASQQKLKAEKAQVQQAVMQDKRNDPKPQQKNSPSKNNKR